MLSVARKKKIIIANFGKILKQMHMHTPSKPTEMGRW
jgi:hypothetical protein